MVSESTAKYSGGPYMAVQYRDVIHPKPEDTRTGNEIAADVIQRAGITLIKTTDDTHS